MNLISYITEGGPVMYVLCMVSVVAVALISYKIFHFWKLGVWSCDCIDSSISQLRKGDAQKSLDILADCKQPSAKVTRLAIHSSLQDELSKSDTNAEIHRVGTSLIREMESYLRGLSVISHLAPLLGLLGTVTGMITAFITLEQSGGVAGPELLAGGIWSALLTTAFGLSIAIPTQAIYYFLEGQVDKVRARMKDAVTRVNILFNQAETKEKTLKTQELAGESYGL